jgi:phage shock protein A
MMNDESTTKSRQLQEQSKQMEQLKERFQKLEREITQKSDEILLLKDSSDREQKRLNSQINDLKTNLQLAENSLKK